MRDQCVGHDETVGRERAHPAVNIQAARSAQRQNHHRKHRGDASDDDRAMWSFVRACVARKRFVRQAVVSHQQQDARGGGDARERSGEKLTSTPISISDPSTGRPPIAASTCIGAWLVPRSWPAMRNPALRCRRTP